MAAKKSFLLRVHPALWAEVERLAQADLRSVNAQVEFLLRDIGFAANRRVLEVETVSHDNRVGALAFDTLQKPVTNDDGQRASALRFGDGRVQALFAVLMLLALNIEGFRNRPGKQAWIGEHVRGGDTVDRSSEFALLALQGPRAQPPCRTPEWQAPVQQ